MSKNRISRMLKKFSDSVEDLFENSSVSREPRLLNQLYTSLDSTFKKVAVESNIKKEGRRQYELVEELLQSRKTWKNAYYIEQLLIDYFDAETLDIEWGRRCAGAKGKLKSEMMHYYEKTYKLEKTEHGKRHLLSKLVNDLQWFYENQQIMNTYERIIQFRVSMTFILAMACFFGPHLFPHLYSSLMVIERGSRDMIIYTAITAGMMGGLFSVLVGLRKSIRNASLPDLRIMKGKTFILSKAAIGGGGGLILYYLLEGQVLSGSIFPAMSSEHVWSDQTYALMIVWCFLSGFSEKMVPNILSATSKKTKKQDEECEEKSK